MAMVKQGKKVLFLGNFWDFHPGCHGTKFDLEDGSEVTIVNFRGATDFARAVAKKTGGKVIIKKRQRPILC